MMETIDAPQKQEIIELFTSHEEWLMHRILEYANRHEFTRYTSTLAEAWRMSIQGLTTSLVTLLEKCETIPELHPDLKYENEPASAFGVLEAKRHRQRGTSLEMFLGLYQYYRQTYIDLVEQSGFEREFKQWTATFVTRFFDRVQIAYVSEWSRGSQDQHVDELQETNRALTNEKNKFLTIFESLGQPVVMINSMGEIEEINQAGCALAGNSMVPGSFHYQRFEGLSFLSPLSGKIREFAGGGEERIVFKRKLDCCGSERIFEITLRRMLDVSNKYTGVTIILNDISELEISKKHLKHLSLVDPLTGLFNRRYLEGRMSKEISRVKREGTALSVCMLDIDHFKEVNDIYDHLTGDEILKNFSDIMTRSLRDADCAARFGGEEFCLILFGTSMPVAAQVAERIRRNIETSQFFVGDLSLSITCSIGVADYEPGDTPERLLKKADKALYFAKASGRNQVQRFSNHITVEEPWTQLTT